MKSIVRSRGIMNEVESLWLDRSVAAYLYLFGCNSGRMVTKRNYAVDIRARRGSRDL